MSVLHSLRMISVNAYFIFVYLLFGTPINEQTKPQAQQDPNVEVFMNYLKQNWDDIHDVIMRYHNDNPYLKGTVLIEMHWSQGKLDTAYAVSNDTGNPTFGESLIRAMKNWYIPDLDDNWEITLPVKTMIKGSGFPDFDQRGILTGNVTDAQGQPLAGATIVAHLIDRKDIIPDTAYTNREGIFIMTLLIPGKWKIECSKTGFDTSRIETLVIDKGQHVKKSIVLN